MLPWGQYFFLSAELSSSSRFITEWLEECYFVRGSFSPSFRRVGANSPYPGRHKNLVVFKLDTEIAVSIRLNPDLETSIKAGQVEAIGPDHTSKGGSCGSS